MKKIIYFIIIASILGFSGCAKFLDVNHDPDAIEEAPIELVLPSALASPLYILGGDGQVIGGYWAQHWTQSTGSPQFQGYDSWQVTNATFDGRGYGSLYFSSLADLEYIRKKAKKEENWSYYLITTVTEAYIYQMLVDLYDEIPFSEALQGEATDDHEANITPKFEKGQAIYDSLIVRLNYALSQDLDAATSEDPGSADIVFDGDMSQWKAFANTLKLRIYLRQSKARPTVAQEGINSLKDETFLSSDACFDIFVNQSDKRNPIYATAEVAHKGNISMSRTLMGYLIQQMYSTPDIRDGRADYLAYRPAQVSIAHRALLQGDFAANKNVDTIQTSPEVLHFGASSIQYLSRPRVEYNDPLYYMTAAESYFLQAEADLLYWGGTNAKDLYENGVKAAFKRLVDIGRVPTDKLDDYSADDVIDGYEKWSDASNQAEQLEIIWLQKWVSMVNIQGLEAFIEHNRTNIPKEYNVNPKEDPIHWDDDYDFEKAWFTISVNNVTSNRYPRRLLVPQSEIDGNPNTPSDLKTKKIYDPIWWDVD